jgi:hypothetical protein
MLYLLNNVLFSTIFLLLTLCNYSFGEPQVILESLDYLRRAVIILHYFPSNGNIASEKIYTTLTLHIQKKNLDSWKRAASNRLHFF